MLPVESVLIEKRAGWIGSSFACVMLLPIPSVNENVDMSELISTLFRFPGRGDDVVKNHLLNQRWYRVRLRW
jgi:hypothetical protein